jgi:elongation factor P hydroxylase
MSTIPSPLPDDDHAVPFDIVVLNGDNEPTRVIHRSHSYAKALGYLERNLPRRKNLDMVQGEHFVDWQLTPGVLSRLDQRAAERLRRQR